LQIKVTKSKLQGQILIPASKSHTIRAFVIAGLANGKSLLKNPLISSDTLSCIEAIQLLGADVKSGNDYLVAGFGTDIKIPKHHIDIGNSGTSLRLLTSVAGMAKKPIAFDGDESIRKRPMGPLFSALKDLGATIESANGKAPFSIRGPIKGGRTEVEGISSQYLSSLLLTCPLLEGDSEITVRNLHEKPYVQITLDWLDSQHIEYETNDMQVFKIKGGQMYAPFEKLIPSDFSSATFAICAAAITNSAIDIVGLDFDDAQGDKEVFHIMRDMGVEWDYIEDGVRIKQSNLKGMEIDMNSIPDALPAMAVTACFARGETRLVNVKQARFKECDRIQAIATELRKMGADIEELEDGLVIKQSKLKGAKVHGYHDHRMVMALTLAGMAVEGETFIDTAESTKVTYPTFINDYQHIHAHIEQI
jgi:3-phosphoshikimate 1-carboxyvinyltransferase